MTLVLVICLNSFKMNRTYKYRLLPNKKQHQELKYTLDEQRFLYNAALQERMDCYKKTGKTITYFDQCKSLKEIKNGFPVNLQRWTLKRVDDAYKAFFRRVKAGDKPGFPRFKPKQKLVAIIR